MVKKAKNCGPFGIITTISGLWDIRTRRINTENIYNVDQIVIYPSYVRNKRDQNDIALVHLGRTLEFRPGTVQPICLPPTVRLETSPWPQVYYVTEIRQKSGQNQSQIQPESDQNQTEIIPKSD